MRFCVICACIVSSSALANTLYVSTTGVDAPSGGGESSPFKSVEYAVKQCAVNGTTILIEDGTYPIGETIEVTAEGAHYDLVIRSRSGNRGGVVLDGQGERRCFSVQSAVRTVIADLTITNGFLKAENTTSSAVCTGAGIYSYNSSLTVSNCVITGCRVDATDCQLWGGGVHMENQNAQLVDSVVENCVASNKYSSTARSVLGGGVCLWGCTAYRTIVRGCSVWSGLTGAASVTQCAGGGIYARTQALVSDCEIVGNEACGGGNIASSYLGCGGGVYASDATIEGSIVCGNTAASMGGGMHLGGSFTVSCCTITNNTVVGGNASAGYGGCGGGIYVYNGSDAETTVVEKCLVAFNDAVTTASSAPLGGGIMVDGCKGLLLADCVVSENRATSGGAISVARRLATKFNTDIVVSNCVFRANVTEKAGGAVTVEASENMNFRDCWFVCNTNKTNVGCIAKVTSSYNRTSGTTFRNCLFRGNVNKGGNGVVYHNASVTYPLEFDACTFVGNSAGLYAMHPESAASAAQFRVKGCVLFEDMDVPVFSSLFANYTANIDYSFCNKAENYPAGVNGNLPVDTNPWFTSSADGNFRPKSNSPLKAAGGEARSWMSDARDMGQGDPEIVAVGKYGVAVRRVKPKGRLLNGSPTIGCCEAWSPGGMAISIR